MPGPFMRARGGREKFDAASLKKIVLYCKPHLPLIIISLFCAIVGSVTTIIGPERISD